MKFVCPYCNDEKRRLVKYCYYWLCVKCGHLLWEITDEESREDGSETHKEACKSQD